LFFGFAEKIILSTNVREIMSQEVLGSSPVGGDHNDDLADALDQ
jgi:hypothetical protein